MVPAHPNDDAATRGEAALPSSICILFFSRIENSSSKLDALTQFSAPLLLRPLDPEAARARQREDTRDYAPRARQVRRLASLVRTKQEVMKCIRAAAERQDPQHHKPLVVLLDGALSLWRLATKLFKPWKRVTFVLDTCTS